LSCRQSPYQRLKPVAAPRQAGRLESEDIAHENPSRRSCLRARSWKRRRRTAEASGRSAGKPGNSPANSPAWSVRAAEGPRTGKGSNRPDANEGREKDQQPALPAWRYGE
jgi:hypothetical protein